MNKGKGARAKVSSSRQSKAKPEAKASQPKPPENGKLIQTKADIDKRSRSEKAGEASSKFSLRKTSHEDALPRGYRGPDGKPRPISKGHLEARPSPSSRTVRKHPPNKSQERSARSVTCDVSDCPEPCSGMNTPKTRTRAPATKLVPKISPESTEKTSLNPTTK